MKPKINYHYTISYKPIYNFLFLRYGVDETCYDNRIITTLPIVVERLKQRPDSRQEVIITNKQYKNYACLISLQFQIVKNRLIMIANFRSQCRLNGRPSDTVMMRYVATLVMFALGLKKYKIYVNVGNYHDNLKLLEENRRDPEVQRNLKFLDYFE